MTDYAFCANLAIEGDELIFRCTGKTDRKTKGVFAVNLVTDEIREIERFKDREFDIVDYIKIGDTELWSYIDFNQAVDFLHTGVIAVKDGKESVIVKGRTDYQVQTITFTELNGSVYFFLYEILENDSGELINRSSLVSYSNGEVKFLDEYLTPFDQRSKGPVIMARQGYMYFEPLIANNHVAYTVYDDTGSLFVLANDEEVIKKKPEFHWGLIGVLGDKIIFLERHGEYESYEFKRKQYNVKNHEINDFHGLRYSYSNFTPINDNQYFYI